MLCVCGRKRCGNRRITSNTIECFMIRYYLKKDDKYMSSPPCRESPQGEFDYDSRLYSFSFVSLQLAQEVAKETDAELVKVLPPASVR